MLSVVMMVSISFSLDITISGKVTDTGTTPLPSAAVKLEKYGLTATSDNNGNFTLTGSVDISNNNNKLQCNKLSARLGTGALFLDVRERGSVEIVTYTLQGKTVSLINQIIDIGTHRITQPDIGNGVYLYRIKSGNSELFIKSHSIGRAIEKKEASDKGGSSSTVFVKRPGRTPINDVIAVTKDGYLNYRVIVTNSDTSNIEIKMIVCADTVRDIDGNLYQAVRIGNQVWMVENLRVTKYIDGTSIPMGTNDSTWGSFSSGAYCFFNYTTNADSIKKFGALYNWYVVNPDISKIAPAGWHVPDAWDWYNLQNYLIANGHNWDGTLTGNKIAKSMAAKSDWIANDSLGTVGNSLITNNSSGFSALPSGFRSGNFGAYRAFWWSSSRASMAYPWAFYYGFDFDSEDLQSDHLNMTGGLSVRLVRN